MDIIVKVGFWAVKSISLLGNEKLKKWVNGRKDLPKKVLQEISANDKVIWLHSASYGEFEEARPIVERIKKLRSEYKLVVTFFSPSGYEPNKKYPKADAVFYLPIDTRREVSRFIDALHPEIAIFSKYEFWPNLLNELKNRKIRTFVVSARFIPNSRFFKWYGGIFRKALETFETIFVQDTRSVELLNQIGFTNVLRAGDPRFDRVKIIAESEWENIVVEKFKSNRKLFVAGSMLPDKDQELIQSLINSASQTRFLIVPHDMDALPMEKMRKETKQKTILYSQCNEMTDFSNIQVLILDRVGMLSKVYRYGDFAFIGGGFDLGIHSVIEATVYGMAVAFGTNFQKNRPGKEMVEKGICTSVANFEELKKWFFELDEDHDKLNQIKKSAKAYTLAECGASQKIVEAILKS